MVSPEELESRHRLKLVKDQIEAETPVGEIKVIDCPYCHLKNYEGNSFCCDTLRRAVLAIMMGKRNEKIAEQSGRYVN